MSLKDLLTYLVTVLSLSDYQCEMDVSSFMKSKKLTFEIERQHCWPTYAHGSPYNGPMLKMPLNPYHPSIQRSNDLYVHQQ